MRSQVTQPIGSSRRRWRKEFGGNTKWRYQECEGDHVRLISRMLKILYPLHLYRALHKRLLRHSRHLRTSRIYLMGQRQESRMGSRHQGYLPRFYASSLRSYWNLHRNFRPSHFRRKMQKDSANCNIFHHCFPNSGYGLIKRYCSMRYR